MPETFTWDEVQPKERFTFEDAQESPVQEGVSLAEHQQLEADWENKFPKQPSPGFFKSAGRAIDESLKATAGGVQLPLATDEELADHLQTELAGLQREEAPKLAGKAGSIAGSLVGTYGQALVTSRLGKGGMAAQFASQGAYDAFMHAGMRALVEGKDVNEAVSIGRKAALAGAAVGAGTGLLLKGRIPDWRTAVRESLKLGAAGAGGRVAQNVTERALGLKTPITEGAVEQGIVMGALPAAGFVTPRLLKAPQTMRDWYEANVNAVREVPMPPQAGPEVPIDAEITSPRGLIPDVPRQLPAPEAEPTPPPRPPSLLDIEEQLRNAPPIEQPSQPETFTYEEATTAQPTEVAPSAQGEAPPEVAAEEVPPTEAAAKEPWQMTRKEYIESKMRPLHDVEKARAEFESLLGTDSQARRTPRFLAAERNLRFVQEENKLKQAANESDRGLFDRIHRTKILDALEQGKPVPAEVLADYPDLAASAEPSALGTGAATTPAEPEIIPGMSIREKEDILANKVRGSILNAPSFPKLVQAYKSFKKSLGSPVRADYDEYIKEQPWEILSAHAGVMNAKSQRAKTLQALADAVIKEANLPMEKPGRFRGQDYRINWDKLAESETKPTEPSQLTHPILGMTEKELSLASLRTLKARNPAKWEQVTKVFGAQKVTDVARLAKQRFEQMREKPKGIAASAREKLDKPLGEETGAVNLGAIADTLERQRQALLSLGRSVPNRHVMDQTFDAADTLAAVSGQQARNNVSIGTTPIQRDAAMAVVESKGDRARLAQFLAQSIAGRNKRAENAVRYAQAHWGALQPLAGRVKARLDAEIAHEQYAGINTEYREGYVPHLYDTDLWMGYGRPYVIGRGGGGIASGFKKGRAFDTIFDAIEAGYVPKSMDVGELVEHRVKVGQRMINRRLWAEALRSVTDPSDGNPIVTSMVHRSRGAGKPGYDVAPTGYSPREVLPGITVAVHEGYAPLFDALTGTSRVSSNAAGYMALKAAGGLKHFLLGFDTFHMGRIMMRQAFLTGKVSYGKGTSLLEYADADLNRAVTENLITPEIANWVRANRPTAQLLMRSGLNVGRIQEALYTAFVRDTPGLKQTLGVVNKWIFEKLTRGAMMESALIEFERVRAAMPSLSDEEVARKVARDLNVYFGNIGSQGIFKSKTWQDISRLFMLAPQWVESMARLEAKGTAQAVKGLTYDPVAHRRLLIGSLGKGLAQGILAMFIGAQILNLVTRKKPTWENPEKGHKLDAWIPDVTGKTPGFFLSPLSVQAELTHDFIRYNETEPSGSKLKVAARIAQNKASPYTRALKVLATGRDWNNQQLISDWERVKAAAWALNPTPIPFSSPLNRNAPPGSLQRQLTASMGLKTEPAPRAGQQILNLVNDWMKENKDPKVRHEWERRQAEEHAASDYKELTQALVSDDLKKAAAEYQKLIDLKKTPERIIQHFQPWGHRFTGSSTANEEKFKKTLTPEQMTIYNAAIEERKALWNKFQALRKQLAQ